MQLIRVTATIACDDREQACSLGGALGEDGNVAWDTQRVILTLERTHEGVGVSGLHAAVDHVIDVARRAGLDVEEDLLECSASMEELIALGDGRHAQLGNVYTAPA